ncbi:hypothetical protein [Embleya sp. NBC_00896]|uniref:hypothetical protein n=1 Tax=Embleya sp. NBC_00896 TaxID=2975961 RepID=UPI00386C6AF3|nr:hypothetical protein OG928_07770 [Embleya sp. NBC_00896]
MELISVDLLSGLAAGAGGDAGRLAWTRLVELVHIPMPRGEVDPGAGAEARAREGGAVPHRAAPVPTGELELTLLGHEAPGGLRAYTRAHALASALSLRADRDPLFARSIGIWYEAARRIRLDDDARHDPASGSGKCDVRVLDEDFNGPFRLDSPPPHNPDDEQL